MGCSQDIIQNIFLSNAEPWKMNSGKLFANMLDIECCKTGVRVSASVHWPHSSPDNYMLYTQKTLQFHLHMIFTLPILKCATELL